MSAYNRFNACLPVASIAYLDILSLYFQVVDIKCLAFNKESVVVSVIQASGTLEFEDDFETEVLYESYWCLWNDCIKIRINSNTLVGSGLVLGVV